MAAIRSDIKIGNLEKKLGLAKGAIRNPDGSDARSDKRLGTLRKEYERMYAGPPVRVSVEQKAAAEKLKAAAAKKAKAAAVKKAKEAAEKKAKATATKKAKAAALPAAAIRIAPTKAVSAKKGKK